MDKLKFDALTRALATGTSRRTAIKGLFGGAVGVAVATTRLNPAGAQGTPCTPETVQADCILPDACTSATCVQGVGTEAYFCSYSGGCDGCDACDTISGTCVSTCEACETCSGGQCVSTCDPCETCVSGVCVYQCTGCQECEGGFCVDLDGGLCCGGTFVPGAQCCDVDDCVEVDATFCSSTACIENLCTAIPECPAGQQCCGLGSEGAYCAECCDDGDCEGCSVCDQGWCTEPECCVDSDCYGCEYCDSYGECQPLLCVEGYTCCGGWECIPEDECCQGVGDTCGLVAAAGGGGSPQYDCCDGLVCCHDWDSSDMVCAECCNDWDCAKGAYCHYGWCEWPDYCDHDKDCPKGTCCCHDGSCSGKCCDHHPHHPKPPKPAPPASGGTVTSLPDTGAGPNDERNSLLGVTALGAAAAILAAKKLRETPEA